MFTSTSVKAKPPIFQEGLPRPVTPCYRMNSLYPTAENNKMPTPAPKFWRNELKWKIASVAGEQHSNSLANGTCSMNHARERAVGEDWTGF